MAPQNSWTKTLVAIAKIAVSAGILCWLFSKAQADDQFAEIAQRKKNWSWLLTAFWLCLLAHFISFVRWRMLVNAIGVPFSTIDAIRIGLIGVLFGNFSIGLIGGDSLRVYYAAKDAKNKLAEIICSVFADRAIGMLIMFSIATLGFMFVDLESGASINPETLHRIQLFCQLIALATATGWIVVLIFLFSPSILKSALVQRLKTLPKIGGLIDQLTDVVLLYRKRLDILLAAVAWSVGVNLCFIFGIYLIAVGLGVVHPNIAQHFVIAPISTSANAIPLPGGLGGSELMLSYFYEAVSSESTKTEHGIVVAFAFRIALWLIASVGAIAWFVNRKQIRRIVDSAESMRDE